jgi:DNA-binding response OmpR family regulator
MQDLILDETGRAAFRSGEKITLRKKEYDLLSFLVQNPGRVLNRLSILEYVWNWSAQVTTNTLEVHMTKLRRKIDRHQNNKLIHTVHGIGYIFKPQS